MIALADRLQQVEEYYFSKKLKEVAQLQADGHSVINLGIGSPDLQPPQAVVQALQKSLSHADSHKYQSYQGLPELRKAIANFYKTHYNVELNGNTNCLPLMGSKEGIMHISMAFLNKGDAVLIPNPGYPTYASVTKLVGATPLYYKLSETDNWLPNLEALAKTNLSKVKLMWVNYPHMPTGANANAASFDALINFAKTHNILLVNDNPYSFILNSSPQSILSRPNAINHCLELNSLSKVFNMAGWRVGMVLGHANYINAIMRVKSNMDSGMFYGIQHGAIKALQSTSEWFKNLNDTYLKRRKLIWEFANKLQCSYTENATGLFVWAKLPKGVNAEVFTDNLLYKQYIFTTPGTVFGSQGEGFVRLSLCQDETIIQQAINRL